MFRSSRIWFRVYYYVSSLSVSYFLLILYIAASYFFDQTINLEKNILSAINIVLYLLLFLFVISLIALYLVRCGIYSTKEISQSNGTQKVIISNKFNVGFRDFIMSVLVPLASTFSIQDQPFATFIVLLLIQIITYKFYINSSDVLPNVALSLIGYALFIANDSNDTDGEQYYVFVETSQIDKVIESIQNITPIGNPEQYNNIFVIVRRQNNDHQ